MYNVAAPRSTQISMWKSHSWDLWGFEHTCKSHGCCGSDRSNRAALKPSSAAAWLPFLHDSLLKSSLTLWLRKEKGDGFWSLEDWNPMWKNVPAALLQSLAWRRCADLSAHQQPGCNDKSLLKYPPRLLLVQSLSQSGIQKTGSLGHSAPSKPEPADQVSPEIPWSLAVAWYVDQQHVSRSGQTGLWKTGKTSDWDELWVLDSVNPDRACMKLTGSGKESRMTVTVWTGTGGDTEI